jgi:hypothetical protein
MIVVGGIIVISACCACVEIRHVGKDKAGYLQVQGHDELHQTRGITLYADNYHDIINSRSRLMDAVDQGSPQVEYLMQQNNDHNLAMEMQHRQRSPLSQPSHAPQYPGYSDRQQFPPQGAQGYAGIMPSQQQVPQGYGYPGRGYQ